VESGECRFQAEIDPEPDKEVSGCLIYDIRQNSPCLEGIDLSGKSHLRADFDWQKKWTGYFVEIGLEDTRGNFGIYPRAHGRSLFSRYDIDIRNAPLTSLPLQKEPVDLKHIARVVIKAGAFAGTSEVMEGSFALTRLSLMTH
jgi:hypothetical protein